MPGIRFSGNINSNEQDRSEGLIPILMKLIGKQWIQTINLGIIMEYNRCYDRESIE